jgi:hypothetical protein
MTPSVEGTTFDDFLKEESLKLFGNSYLQMKQFLYQQGVVGDVFKEISNYLPSIKTIRSVKYPTKELYFQEIEKYFIYHPYSYNDYLTFFYKKLNKKDDIPYYLLPNIDEILSSEYTYVDEDDDEYLEGYQLYIYKKYLILYEYSIQCHIDSDGDEEYLYEEDVLQFPSLNRFRKVLADDIKVYELEGFDYRKFIDDNEIIDINHIVKLYRVCDPDSFTRNILELCESI